MSILQEMGTGQGYLKAGFLGFPKGGKTYTAALLLIAVRRLFKLDAPIAMYDTETGSEYIHKMIEQLTGRRGLVARSRSFADLMAFAEEVEKGGYLALADSVTHPWRELCDAYLAQVNKGLKSRNRAARTQLEFQDWAPIKERWAKFTDWYLNSKAHVVICGRAGFEYDYEEDEETGRKKLQKTGIKMKTETEFGFEPSLLIRMEREQVANGGMKLIHRATVLGDRFSLLDGQMHDFVSQGKDHEKALAQVAKFFAPHLEALTPGAHSPVDTTLKTDMQIDEDGNSEAHRQRREHQIVIEEIQGELLRAWPGQTKEEKVAKTDVLEAVFETRSWTKIEGLPTEKLKPGLAEIRKRVALYLGKPVPEPEPAGAEPLADDEIPFD